MGESTSSGNDPIIPEVIEKLTFLDEVGVQKLAEAILKKSNSRISDRIVQELNDASDANHVVSAALLNTLLKARDTLIGANTTAIATNKTDADKLVADVGDLTTKVDDNTTNVTAVADGITALDEKIAGLTHLTIDMVVGPISGVTDPKSDVLYLQKDDEADTTWMLYIYREDNTWAQIGDTGVDLSDYWSKDDNAAIKDAVGVPEVTPLAEDKILAAINAAFDNTDVLTPKDPNLQYLNITADGCVTASDKLRAMTADTPVDLVIPPEINGIKVTGIGEAGFDACRSLRSVTIPEGVTRIGSFAFPSCSILTSIDIPDGITYIGEEAFYCCESLTSVTIPASVTTIGDSAFEGCNTLTSIDIPEGVTYIGVAAFYFCKSLTSVTIPNSVTSISNHTFRACKSLTSITIPNSVTSIGISAFGGDDLLTSIDIPASVTTIGDSAFGVCTALVAININKPQNSITGAPWGAPSATVNWLG